MYLWCTFAEHCRIFVQQTSALDFTWILPGTLINVVKGIVLCCSIFKFSGTLFGGQGRCGYVVIQLGTWTIFAGPDTLPGRLFNVTKRELFCAAVFSSSQGQERCYVVKQLGTGTLFAGLTISNLVHTTNDHQQRRKEYQELYR